MNITEKQYNEITFKGAKWLLLFVFYLQFLIPVFLESKWVKYTDRPLPEILIIISIQLFAVFVPCLLFIYLNSASVEKSFKLYSISVPHGVMCALIGLTAQSVASVLNIPVLFFIKNKTGIFSTEATDWAVSPINAHITPWGTLIEYNLKLFSTLALFKYINKRQGTKTANNCMEIIIKISGSGLSVYLTHLDSKKTGIKNCK